MATPKLRLCLVLHNHQPVGNFDNVIEQAYRDSYLPFLDVFESYPRLRIGLHTSGPLAVWLQQRHPEYLDRVASLVQQDRIEIIGGAFYEPILSMIPSRDRQGQIRRFSKWLNHRFRTQVRGMWIPERVWEPELVSDLADAGIQYTILDDFHFRCSGLSPESLNGDFVTEDQGRVLRVFPGSEQLRYTIPFREPVETIDYLQEIAASQPNSTVVFADDGEKFGTWPGTCQHVHENGWLRRFFDALVENQDWLDCCTLAEATANSLPKGRIFLPTASYREMTEWSLPVETQLEYQHLKLDLENDWRWPKIKKFIRGGFWRNFKCWYPETNEMYARMMYVSSRLAEAEELDAPAELLDQARECLYQGQCNCAYWHGAFGGVYLPHLRNAIYHHLIVADNLIEQAMGTGETCSIVAADFNFDLRPEIRLANPNLVCWMSPSCGGHLYELDVRSIGHNLLATINRRREAYHDQVEQGASSHSDQTSSIHDRVVFKQENLDQMLQYDQTPRKSLVDHFWHQDTTLDEVARCQANPLGDFATGTFESTMRRSPDRNQLLLTRTGQVGDHQIQITKGVTLAGDDSSLSIAYLLEGLPKDEAFRFGVEFNFAGLPADNDDRLFLDKKKQSIGHLGEQLDLQDCDEIRLSDQWLGIEVELNWDRPGTLWAFPIRSVSQSEGGFELVHQSVSVQPNWIVKGDANGRWAVKINLGITTNPAVALQTKPPGMATPVSEKN